MIKRYKEYRDYYFENVHKKELKFSDDYIKAEWAFEEWLYGQIIDAISDSLIEWHDVKDGDFPPEKELVLIHIVGWGIYQGLEWEETAAFYDGDWDTIKGWWIIDTHVTHWAYLPKPPLTHKEQSQ